MEKRLQIAPLLFIFLVVILSACTTSRQAVILTPTLDPLHWKVYQDVNQNFSFEYPKSFDDRSLCALKVKQADSSSPTYWVSLNNSDLKVSLNKLANPKDTDPQIYVDQLRSMLSQQAQISLEKPTQLTVAGLPAMAQRYHTAYTKDGYLEYVFFVKNGTLYTISLNTPSTCDGYPDIPTGVEAYQRILSSFRIQ
jgi:hypothetical protein